MRIFIDTVGNGQFWARLEDSKIYHLRSRQPLLDAARQALEDGHDPSEIIEMWQEGASTWALRSTIGQAAKLTVVESGRPGTPRFQKWRAFTLDRK